MELFIREVMMQCYDSRKLLAVLSTYGGGHKTQVRCGTTSQ